MITRISALLLAKKSAVFSLHSWYLFNNNLTYAYLGQQFTGTTSLTTVSISLLSTFDKTNCLNFIQEYPLVSRRPLITIRLYKLFIPFAGFN